MGLFYSPGLPICSVLYTCEKADDVLRMIRRSFISAYKKQRKSNRTELGVQVFLIVLSIFCISLPGTTFEEDGFFCFVYFICIQPFSYGELLDTIFS